MLLLEFRGSEILDTDLGTSLFSVLYFQEVSVDTIYCLSLLTGLLCVHRCLFV